MEAVPSLGVMSCLLTFSAFRLMEAGGSVYASQKDL